MRLGVLMLTVALVVAGCGEAPAPSGVVLYESEHGITVADGTGTVLSRDAAVPSPDRSRLYAVRGGELVTVETAANRELARTAVPAGFTARVASAAGTLVALTEDRAGGRERTAIVVADPSGRRPVTRLTLAGNFEPEAFSSDGEYLFVLEYLPPMAPDRYRVRRVLLATGEVQPLLLRDKTVVPSGAEEEMRGEGRQAVLSPDRTRLYTLYLHQGDHQHTRDLLPGRRGADGRAVHAFVHVLSLTEGWAYCLDLPDPFGLHPAGTHALTIAPDGATLYVAEMTQRQVAVADTGSLTVTRVAPLGDDRPGGDGTAMSTSPDGATLYIGSSNVVRRLDIRTLTVDAAWPQPVQLRGLAVSPDGRHLLLGQAGRIVRLDSATGEVLGTVPAEGLTSVLG